LKGFHGSFTLGGGGGKINPRAVSKKGLAQQQSAPGAVSNLNCCRVRKGGKGKSSREVHRIPKVGKTESPPKVSRGESRRSWKKGGGGEINLKGTDMKEPRVFSTLGGGG